MNEWKRLGRIAPEELGAARLELHHAVQVPAIGVGRHVVPRRDDDTNTALTWEPEESAWWGEEIPGSGGVRAGLRPADLALVLRRGDGERRELELAGRTLGDGVAWLRQGLAELGVDPGPVSMEAHFTIPDHPVASGRAFSPQLLAAAAEIGRYFHDAHLLLADLAAEGTDGAILTWPHHFDVGDVISLGGRRSIEVGLSPGDGYYPVPYLYVTPRPAPSTADLPPLPGGGEWSTGGWTGAVLQAPALTAIADGAGQRQRAREFFAAAVAACRSLLA